MKNFFLIIIVIGSLCSFRNRNKTTLTSIVTTNQSTTNPPFSSVYRFDVEDINKLFEARGATSLWLFFGEDVNGKFSLLVPANTNGPIINKTENIYCLYTSTGLCPPECDVEVQPTTFTSGSFIGIDDSRIDGKTGIIANYTSTLSSEKNNVIKLDKSLFDLRTSRDTKYMMLIEDATNYIIAGFDEYGEVNPSSTTNKTVTKTGNSVRMAFP